MAKPKKRILIRVVTKDSSTEFEVVEGAPLLKGGRSPGPSDRQYAIANRAIADLIRNEVG